ncbi:MAG TPA: hypothetical protein VGI58_21215 [Streptosporangiaceae bacterium]
MNAEVSKDSLITTPQEDADARADWEQRIYQRAPEENGTSLGLVAPAGLTATPGAGHVGLTWQPVPGAAGYVIERSRNGEAGEILRHGGSDVAAVPAPPFADTGLLDGERYHYRVAAVAGAEYPVHAWSQAVVGHTTAQAPEPVQVTVEAGTVTGQLDRVWRMTGSERLTQLRPEISDPTIASEFAESLQLAHSDLGASMVRAHAILQDDNAVCQRDAAGGLRFDFSRVDAIYDQVLRLGLRPVVELSYMPAALARDPEQTVFTYRGIISPPADWTEWRLLVTELTAHLVQRYGINEVAEWAFEVWNEPNLIVFWPGTQADYLRLYDEAAGAVKAVDPRLRIGGPATAASEWLEVLAAHCAATGTPLDFVSTHTYGNMPLDVRPALRRHGLDGIDIWWTEWGAGSTHYGPVHDSVLGAPFVLSGMHGAQGRVDAIAYWVISDHFEELGRPTRLFHNGFGLLTIGNLRKPRYWALHLAAHLGDDMLATRLAGDGAGMLVQAWATRNADGTVDILVWNGTINAALLDGDPRLDRHVQVTVTGLGDAVRAATLARVDQHHSNIAAHCPPDVTWPDEALWQRLRAADVLDTQHLPDVTPSDGVARFDFALPMPGIARIRLSASRAAARQG